MVLNTSREAWRGGEDRPPLLYSSREAMNEDFREEARPAGRYRARRFPWGYWIAVTQSPRTSAGIWGWAKMSLKCGGL